MTSASSHAVAHIGSTLCVLCRPEFSGDYVVGAVHGCRVLAGGSGPCGALQFAGISWGGSEPREIDGSY